MGSHTFEVVNRKKKEKKKSCESFNQSLLKQQLTTVIDQSAQYSAFDKLLFTVSYCLDRNSKNNLLFLLPPINSFKCP